MQDNQPQLLAAQVPIVRLANLFYSRYTKFDNCVCERVPLYGRKAMLNDVSFYGNVFTIDKNRYQE
jgi:hypothetical protein